MKSRTNDVGNATHIFTFLQSGGGGKSAHVTFLFHTITNLALKNPSKVLFFFPFLDFSFALTFKTFLELYQIFLDQPLKNYIKFVQ